MKRVFGLDLIRVVAIFFVLSVHFFLNNGFYNYNIRGKGMFVSIFIRWIFYLGVPLFLLLTGYLKRKKTLTKKYYKSIVPILVSYLFISILCGMFRMFYLKEDISKLELLLGIFNFKTCKYAWYVEMYIGLFLLIPFLNVMYNSLNSRKHKQYLIWTLLTLVSFSPIVSSFTVRNMKLDIIPNWWNQLYPLVYYFIGCYINEYQIKINKKRGIFYFFVIIILEAIATYVSCYNTKFDWDLIGEYNSIQTVMAATLLFLILYNVKTPGKIVKKMVMSVSNVSFDMYLFSYITDSILYKYFDSHFKTPVFYLKHYFLVIALSFLLAYILSYMKKILFSVYSSISSRCKKVRE